MADQIAVCEAGNFIANGGYAYCSSGRIYHVQLQDIAEQAASAAVNSFSFVDLNPADLAGLYSTGFVLVGSVWLIGWAVRELLALIKR